MKSIDIHLLDLFYLKILNFRYVRNKAQSILNRDIVSVSSFHCMNCTIR